MNLNSSKKVSVLLVHSFQLLTRKTHRVMASQKNYESLLASSDKWFNRYEQNAPIKGIFAGVTDRFNGITVDSRAETCDDGQFDSLLNQSLDTWIEQKKRAIWFRVHRDQAIWVPSLAKQGFLFHHARDEFVMMYRWLPKNEQMSVPPFAHTMVGVGALVINDKNEVLVVSERNALIPNSWKLPGGYCEMKEDLVDAAIREVQEETNIQTKFESIISVRHAHSAAFGCSDLYFIMKLIPLTEDIVKCEREIADCKWMNINEYLSHKDVHETNRNFVKHWMELKNKRMLMDVVEKTHEKLNRKYQIFFPRGAEDGNAGSSKM